MSWKFLSRIRNSPFSALQIILTVGRLSEWNDWNSKGVNEREGNRIHVQWNENVSYYQEFSNAQVVAKSSVKERIC